MQEKTIPWWRKALKFALGGIRSGFGFFPRPARLARAAVPAFSGGHKEIPEEERALTKVFPKFEMAASATPADVKARHVRVAKPESEPVRVKEKAGAARGIPEEVSGAKAHVDTASVVRGLKPPPPSGSDYSAAREAEPETASRVPVEAVAETEPKQIPVLAAETEAVSEPSSEQIEETEPIDQAVEDSTEEVESVVRVEAGQVHLPEPVAVTEPVEEAAPEPFEEEVEAAVEQEIAEAPEPVDVVPSEPVKEPEPVVESEREAEASTAPVPDSTIEQAVSAAEQEAAPVPEPISACEPTEKISPETERVEIPASEAAAEPASAPEPAAEATSGPDTMPSLVLTVQPSAEEKADTKADEKAAAKLAARQKKLDESSEQSPFSVFVGQVYDGPLDLLLDLIRKQDIDIYDIPIARITAQFLAYVNQLKAGDVDVAGEFIYTASLLIHIKSKMLLPRAAHGSGRRGRGSAARAGGAAAGARALQERRADAAAEADARGRHVDQSRRARVQGR